MREQESNMNSRIAERVEVPENSASVILAVAPCRSGTTAQLRVFAGAGIQAHYQPLKAIMREIENGKEGRFVVPADKQTIFIKETVGPYTDAESTLDPVSILLNAGLPKDKLHVIPMLRQPLVTFASWVKVNEAVKEFFGGAVEGDVLLRNVIRSYNTVSRIRDDALCAKIPTTTYVQESLRDNRPEQVVKSMLARTGVSYNPSSVSGWKELAPLGSPKSGIIFHPEGTAPYEDQGSTIIHRLLTESDGLIYHDKEESMLHRIVDDTYRRKLYDSGIYELYDRFRRACERDLRLRVIPSPEVKQVIV